MNLSIFSTAVACLLILGVSCSDININGNWLQKGCNIEGEAAKDQAGEDSVSISGNGRTVAVGSARNDGNGSDSGHVRVFALNSTQWVQIGRDIDGEDDRDRSGASVSLSEDGYTLAVGAAYNDDTAGDAGHVRIYEWSTMLMDWVQKGSDIDGDALWDLSGYSVALNGLGSIVVIGAVFNHGSGGTINAGHVRVYEWSISQSDWVQKGSDIDGEDSYDHSGESVAVSRDGLVIAVGADGNDGNGTSSGHVRVFEWSETQSAWLQKGADIDGEAIGDSSGVSLAMTSDGSSIAVGARYNDGVGGYHTGHARIYEYVAVSGMWVQKGADIDGQFNRDEAGNAVSINSIGTIVAVGALYNDNAGDQAGHVRVFEWSIAQSDWLMKGPEITRDTGAGRTDNSSRLFGSSVALSNDGLTLAIGVPLTARETSNGEMDAGYVMVVEYALGASPTAQPTHQAQLQSWQQVGGEIPGIGGAVAREGFGWAVAASQDGSVLAIGARSNSDNGRGSGRIQMYHWVEEADSDDDVANISSNGSDRCCWRMMGGSDIKGGSAGDAMGYAVALSRDGSIVAAGAPGMDNVNGSLRNAGQVQVYRWQPEESNNSTSTAATTTTTTSTRNGTWVQMGSGGLEGIAYSDGMSVVVALSGDGTVVAASSTVNNNSAGYVRILEWKQSSSSSSVEGTWEQKGRIIVGEAAGDESGTAIALSDDGSVLAIGSPQHDGLNGTSTLNSGMVRVFEWSSSAADWVARGPSILGRSAGDWLGSAVALSCNGAVLAMGAPYTTDANVGTVWVYEWSSANATWIPRGEGGGGGGGIGDNATSSVVVVEERGIITSTTTAAADTDSEAGFSVSLSCDGTEVAVGAPGYNDSTGQMQVYQYIAAADSDSGETGGGGGEWVQIGDKIDGERPFDKFGSALALSGDGSRVAIGAYLHDIRESGSTSTSHTNDGTVRVLERSATLVPTPAPTELPSSAFPSSSPTELPSSSSPSTSLPSSAPHSSFMPSLSVDDAVELSSTYSFEGISLSDYEADRASINDTIVESISELVDGVEEGDVRSISPSISADAAPTPTSSSSPSQSSESLVQYEQQQQQQQHHVRYKHDQVQGTAIQSNNDIQGDTNGKSLSLDIIIHVVVTSATSSASGRSGGYSYISDQLQATVSSSNMTKLLTEKAASSNVSTLSSISVLGVSTENLLLSNGDTGSGSSGGDESVFQGAWLAGLIVILVAGLLLIAALCYLCICRTGACAVSTSTAIDTNNDAEANHVDDDAAAQGHEQQTNEQHQQDVEGLRDSEHSVPADNNDLYVSDPVNAIPAIAHSSEGEILGITSSETAVALKEEREEEEEEEATAV